jgi:nucleoside-diphosphate-sugar epimerase
MKIAVVGATGVLGCNLIPLLLQDKHSVRTLVRSPQKAQTLFSQAVEIVECDLLSPNIEKHLPSRLKGCEAVVHIATAIPRDFAAPGAWDANTCLRTEGTERLLKASIEVGVKRYIQQSITLAYPDNDDNWITEGVPLDSSPSRALICAPVIAMENMVRETSIEQLQWCILRGGTFVGKGTFQDTTIENLLAGREVVAGDGSNFISLVSVADMASAIAVALVRAPAGSIFNIVDEPIRQGEYIDRLATLVGASKPQRDANLQRPLSLRCSNQAAKAILSWLPRHSLFPEV